MRQRTGRRPRGGLAALAVAAARSAAGSGPRGLWRAQTSSWRLASSEEQLRQASDLTARLLHVAERLSSAVAVPHICETIADAAVEGVHGREAWLVLEQDLASSSAPVRTDPVAARLLGTLTADGPLAGPAFERAPAAGPPGGPLARGAYAALPLRASGVTLAHLVVLDATGRDWSANDVRFLSALADQGGNALSRGRAYEMVATASSTLQASLRPGRRHPLPGLTLHCAYRPLAPGHEVGGDWFDSIDADEDRAVLVIGDVMGKGWRAAAVMGQVRTALRTAAKLGLDPAAALDVLDAGVVDLRPDELVTVLYAVIDRRRGQVGLARAGHPPALLISPDHRAAYVESDGSPPIGMRTGDRPETWLPLEQVAQLVLFTDGVVESRGADLGHGLDAFRRQAMAVARSAEARDQRVWDAWLDELRTSPDRQDDVAVMIARLDHQTTRTSGLSHDTR